MKLYYASGACSLSPRIILEESGLPYEAEAVDLKTKLTASGADYDKISPKGYVPALILDNGELLTEGPAIVQYVADQVPEKNLVPANGTLARYHVQEWLNFIGTELHKSCSPFFNPASGDTWRAAATENLQRRLAYVNAELRGKVYLMGDEFSVADAYLFTTLKWMGFIHFDISRFPHVEGFLLRVAARPAVQAALAKERAA